MCLCKERTDFLGFMGLTHVDLGFDKSCVSSCLVGESVVVERGLSWSDKDGFFFAGTGLLELQEIVNFLGGLVKKKVLLV